MDIATFFGFVIGITGIVAAVIFNGGDFYDFLDAPSAMIVLGGTLAATFINFPLRDVFGVFIVAKNAFKSIKTDYSNIIDRFLTLAGKVREGSIMSLEEELPEIKDEFLRKGLELAINERDPDRLRNYLNLELSNIERRHEMGQEIFYYMGAYAPAFGLVGTVMGLIMMLKGFSAGEGVVAGVDISSFEMDTAQKFAKLLEGMAVALITTFYGILLSNLVFLPLGGKLKRRTDTESMTREIMIEGIMCLQNREHPLVVKDKLNAFIPARQRKIEEKKKADTE